MSDMLKIEDIEVGDILPVREYAPDNIQLFLYNAALWNAHRIHFDHPWAMDVEGYPGIVVPGPLMGDWITQVAIEWIGDAGDLVNVNYSNRQFAIAGEILRSQGTVTAVRIDEREVDLEVNIINAAGDVLTPSKLTMRFN